MWNHATQTFVSKNKYRGREIKTSDFANILRTFLDDGDRILTAHIPVLIQKLHNLAAIIIKLGGFRFYGCSLLLIYDGDKEAQDLFARQRNEISKGDEEVGTGDGGRLSMVKEETSRPVEISPSPGRRSRSVDHHSHSHLRRLGHHSHHSHSHSSNRSSPHPDNSSTPKPTPLHTKKPSHRLRGEINLRVVDFAHTTTGVDFIPMIPNPHEDIQALGKAYDTLFDAETGLALARFPPKHKNRADMGFIFGLKSVVSALRDIWSEEVGTEDFGELENADVFERAFGLGEVDLGELST